MSAEVFFGDFSNADSVFNNFNVEPTAQEGIEIIAAVYTYECYEGDARVLFRKNGKLYWVTGGHCSCNGLEGLWEPFETTQREVGSKATDALTASVQSDPFRRFWEAVLRWHTENWFKPAEA